MKINGSKLLQQWEQKKSSEQKKIQVNKWVSDRPNARTHKQTNMYSLSINGYR